MGYFVAVPGGTQSQGSPFPWRYSCTDYDLPGATVLSVAVRGRERPLRDGQVLFELRPSAQGSQETLVITIAHDNKLDLNQAYELVVPGNSGYLIPPEARFPLLERR